MATTIRNSNLFCLNCGMQQVIKYPIDVQVASLLMKKFEENHAECKPVWKEPVADLEKTTEERMEFWLTYGERGSSSETMFQVISGKEIRKSATHHPLDPDDFSRCFKLLDTLPEWKGELYKMKSVSESWSALVDNWSKLNEMYLDMMVTKKDNGMYDYMQKVLLLKK